MQPLNPRQQLRQTLKAKRLALTDAQQQHAAQSLISPALKLIDQHQAQHLAFYLPFRGEISPLPLMQILLAQGKSLYLPVLHPFSPQQLLFLRYQGDASLKPNRFGILEPVLDVRKVLPLTKLEMIFTPLVGFDLPGNRLGMGGGFYDRTLAQRPELVSVGLAHRCQQVEQLPIEKWDMPLDYLLIGETE